MALTPAISAHRQQKGDKKAGRQSEDNQVLFSFLSLMRQRKNTETRCIRQQLGLLDSDIAQVRCFLVLVIMANLAVGHGQHVRLQCATCFWIAYHLHVMHSSEAALQVPASAICNAPKAAMPMPPCLVMPSITSGPLTRACGSAAAATAAQQHEQHEPG